MLKSDLVNLLVARGGISQRQAEQTIEHIFETMKAALVRGETIEIRGLGAFHVKHYKGYKGRNPKTLKPIEVRPKRGVLFRSGKELKDRVNAPAVRGAAARPAARAQPPAAADPTETAA